MTENAVDDVNPVFSPDGRRIAFGELTARNRGALAMVGAKGGVPRG